MKHNAPSITVGRENTSIVALKKVHLEDTICVHRHGEIRN